MHVLIQCFVLIMLCGCIVYSQVEEGSSCKTPIGQSGSCLSIYNCKIFLNLISKPSGITQEERDYLRRSSCGFIGSTPYVCCPQQDTRTLHTVDPVEEKIVNTEYNFLSPPQCGYSNASFPRVVGGIPAKLGEFPFLVALGYRNPNNPNQPKWLCGGTLITNRHVLTAAHCVANRRDLYIARVGELDLYDDAEGANPIDIAIAKAKIHENYSATKYINDIAILTLARSTEGLNNIWPICLPWEKEKQSMSYVGKQPFVAGWGSVYFNGPSSTILQYATIPVLDNSKCVIAYANMSIIDDTLLCAGHAQGEKDACRGDSGGPLMHGVINKAEKRIEFFQIGVVSYGRGCADARYPGVYTRVTSFLNWINQNIE